MSKNSGSDDVSGTPSLEQTMQVLSDDQRRETLSYLFRMGVGSTVAVEDLAEHVTGDDETYERVYESLYHSHLPRLEAAGIVTYERSEESVRLAGDQSSVEELLTAGRKLD